MLLKILAKSQQRSLLRKKKTLIRDVMYHHATNLDRDSVAFRIRFVYFETDGY